MSILSLSEVMEKQEMQYFSQKYAAKAGEIFGIQEWSSDLNLIRIYQLLSVLLGGSETNMRHWFQTQNKHLENKVPANLITTSPGTMQILNYLEFFNEH